MESFYRDEFRLTLDHAVENDLYLGHGNPNARILIIGKEATEELAEVTNPVWLANVEKNITDPGILPDCPDGTRFADYNPLFPYKGMTLQSQPAGHTWRKYQKLHDFVFGRSTPGRYDFHRNFFCSEMNQSFSRTTREAEKSSVGNRKFFFKSSAFFQSFPVVILACSNYITGPEIEDIFGVRFRRREGEKKGQLYWLHDNGGRPGW